MFLKYRFIVYGLLVLLGGFLFYKWVGPGFFAPLPPHVTSSTSGGNSKYGIQDATTTVPTEADYRTELRQAIAAFQKVKSFRAKVVVGPSSSEINALLEYAKPDRFRGTIQSKDAGTAEIITVGNSLYMRVNGQAWVNLSKTASAKTISDTLKNALNGDSNLANIGIDDTLAVSKTHDDVNQCDSYQTTVKTASSTTNDITLCIADGLPSSMDLETAQGPIHLQYYDYNAVFLITKPIQ